MIEGSAAGSAPAAASPAVCPYLGLADDPRTHFAFATTAHRCHSATRPERIEVSQQSALCLSADYPTCKRYVVATATSVGPAVVPTATSVGPAVVPTATSVGPAVLAVLPGPAEAPIANVSSRRRRVVRAAVVRAAVVLVGVLTLAIIAAVVLGQGGSPNSGPSGVSGSNPPGSLASPAASLASPTVNPQPTPTASLTSTSGPTPRPTASVRSRPITHIVVRGENLTSIARHYGITLDALEKANGIKNPSLITVGQRLIIPPP